MPEVVLCDLENDIATGVVVEVAHPTLRFGEWRERFLAHAANCVGEYYLIHPGPPLDVEIWCRSSDQLAPVRNRHDFVSQRLGLRFELDGEGLKVFDADGQPLTSFAELVAKLRELGISLEATS